MRVLTITSHISSNTLPCFQRNKTGFGYMVRDVIKAIAQREDVDVLVYYYRYGEQKLDGARYLGCSIWDIVRNLFSAVSPSLIVHVIRSYPLNKGSLLRLIYCWMLTGYYRRIIRTGHYDIVHIHGCSINAEMWIQLCELLGQKFIVTLHGLNSFSNTINIDEAGKQYERDFLKRVVDGEFPITVISTGIKRIIEETFCQRECDTIRVVLNSISLSEKDADGTSDNPRIKYCIPPDAKILLYVGNISYNKNQVQMVRAFSRLPDSLRLKTFVLFIGNLQDADGGLRVAIERSADKEHLILCGGIEKNQMPSLYHSADGVILLSHAEGFGLSLAEGMFFGLPSATFTDLDAFEDLYSPDAMVPIPSRSDEAVALALEEVLTKDWNPDSIRAVSVKFNPDTMAQNYIITFQSVCSSNE